MIHTEIGTCLPVLERRRTGELSLITISYCKNFDNVTQTSFLLLAQAVGESSVDEMDTGSVFSPCNQITVTAVNKINVTFRMTHGFTLSPSLKSA